MAKHDTFDLFNKNKNPITFFIWFIRKWRNYHISPPSRSIELKLRRFQQKWKGLLFAAWTRASDFEFRRYLFYWQSILNYSNISFNFRIQKGSFESKGWFKNIFLIIAKMYECSCGDDGRRVYTKFMYTITHWSFADKHFIYFHIVDLTDLLHYR